MRGGSGGRPGEAEVAAFCRDRPKLETCRRRLADLSWFMRCLNEPIARRANREDECTGRFWEGRFKCQRLDDEGAALACMVYVDLNPVRAGMAGTPESSDFTSAQDRCVAYRARLRLRRALPDLTPQQAALVKRSEADATRDVWLAPIGTRDGDGDDRGGASETSGATLRPPVHTGAKDQAPSLLAHLREEDYLELLDWTGREIRAEKRGHISPELRPVLERFDLDVNAWVENVERYGGLFSRLAGKLSRLREVARTSGRAWLCGQRGARQLYTAAA
jgi:hypothetical protein